MDSSYKMFDATSNFELRQLARDLPWTAPEYIKDELSVQERNGHESHGSQIRFLNRIDLLHFIYGWILPEIQRIDRASKEELPLLINETWSCLQLHERVLHRLRTL